MAPYGENLTVKHQRRAASYPKVMKPKGITNECLDDAVLRYQQAKADTESLDAEKRALDVARTKGELIPFADARDEIEATHLAWVAELEQLPYGALALLPPEVPSSVRESLRGAIESACIAARRRIGGA